VPERDWLYPCASLPRAVTRETRSGQVLAPAERVAASQALRLFLADPCDLHRTRIVAVGGPADLCVLRAPLTEALTQPSAAMVRAVLCRARAAAASLMVATIISEAGTPIRSDGGSLHRSLHRGKSWLIKTQAWVSSHG